MSSASPTSKRPKQTAIDYAVVAVSPALIMTLVGSLVFFLLEVFQQSSYDFRSKFIFGLWVFAAVLISRISMEEGKSRAMLFAAPLGVLMAIAVFRFVEFGDALGPLAYPLNLCLLGFIWWATDKLTWDCTLVDEQQDASGKGLLQTMQGDDSAEEPRRHEEPAATASSSKSMKDWWRRFQEKRRRPHPHGVWVIYFSVAALPLFGLGQVFVIESERGHAFFLLWVYLFSGFGLLVTTSLLGLRRYLRQRRIQMPDKITTVWLSVGGVLIVALMLAALLVPRSFAQLAPPESSGRSDADLATSKYATGRDGRQEEDADRTSEDVDGQPAGSASKEGDSDNRASGSQEDDAGGGSSGESGDQSSDHKDDSSGGSGKATDEGSSKSDDGSSSESENSSKSDAEAAGDEGGSASGEDDPPDSASSGGGSESGDDTSGQQSSGSSQDSSPDNGGQSESSDSQSQGGQESEGGQTSDRDEPSQTDQADENADDAESNSFSLAEFVSSLSEWFVLLLKWIFFLAVAIGAAYFAWKNRVELLQTIRSFWRELRELCQRLLRKKPKATGETEQETNTGSEDVRPFAAFQNPFLSGAVTRLSPNELVKYTFEAFEAWAIEQGSPRDPEQTPHEFAQQVGVRRAALLASARQLADLYCQAAYAPQSVSASNVDCLKELWQQLQQQEVFA